MPAPKDPIKYQAYIKRLSESHKGQTPKTAWKKGNKPWNAGTAKIVNHVCKMCNKSFITVIKRNDRPSNYCSIICSIKNLHRPEIIRKRADTQTGLKRSYEFRKNRSGNNCHFWKGGITPINLKVRNSIIYKNWRKSVFERDNYTCQECRDVGGILNADHIKPFSLYPELRFELSNGRTLCIKCHRKTNTYGMRVKKYILKEKVLCQ